MIKSIKMKKVIGEKPEKRLEEELMEKDLYISLDDIPTDQKYDCDMSPSEQLASEIVFRLAEKAAESFRNAMDGLNIISIKHLISMLEDAESEKAVSMLQAVFLSNEKRTDAEMLDLLGLCKNYYDGSFDDFMDSFMQADEIDWFVMDNWLDEYREPTDGMKIVNGRLLDVEGDCSM
ncbi:MAG: hypothetical protein J6D57_06390 [Mogibacterium sp.]|nr:hypothetical protein [Mogibacterium sp.]